MITHENQSSFLSEVETVTANVALIEAAYVCDYKCKKFTDFVSSSFYFSCEPFISATYVVLKSRIRY